MSNLQYRQTKIQDKRKQTQFRDYLMEIASRYTISLNKNSGMVSRYPDTDRMGEIVSRSTYEGLGNQEIETPYDNGRDFMSQLFSLRKTIKHPSTLTFAANQNSEYADVVFGTKNAHLAFTVGGNSENILYSTISYINCTNIINSVQVIDNSQNVYYSKCVSKGYNIFYSRYIDNCADIWFSSNLIGCNHCIGCDNLINQSYCIDNVQLSHEEYMNQKYKILEDKSQFDKRFVQVNNDAINYHSDGCEGSGINYSSNIINGYYVSRATNGRNMMFISGINHANHYHDVFESGIDSDDFYAVSNAGSGCNHIYCSTQVEKSSNLFYCYHMETCSFCLGCIGLKNKSYCILNKQYTKEEWNQKVEEIFGQMDTDGTLGEFFPARMNPFYFNDTAAYLIDPSFTKEEVTAAGYLWRDEPIKVDIPEGAQTVTVDKLGNFEGWSDVGTNGSTSDKIRTIDESICKKVIIDHEGNAYRVIPMELEFLIKHGLPLPRKHWLDRMKDNFRIH